MLKTLLLQSVKSRNSHICGRYKTPLTQQMCSTWPNDRNDFYELWQLHKQVKMRLYLIFSVSYIYIYHSTWTYQQNLIVAETPRSNISSTNLIKIILISTRIIKQCRIKRNNPLCATSMVNGNCYKYITRIHQWRQSCHRTKARARRSKCSK